MPRSRSRLALCVFLTLLLPLGLLAAPAAAAETWTQFGPAGLSINFLKTDPTAPGTVYLSSGVGLFKSTDGGQTWFGSGSGLESNSLGALVIDPSRPGVLYGLSRGKLFGSTDGGASWRLLSSLPTEDLNSAKQELAIGGDGTLYAAHDHRLYASSDRGGTWTLILDSEIPSIQSLAVDPTAPGTLYVATGAVSGGVAIPAPIRKTEDGGLTWKEIAGDLLPSDLSLGLGTIFLGVAATHPATVYAGIASRGAFKSTDGGATWRRLPLDETSLYFRPTALTLDPTGSGHPVCRLRWSLAATFPCRHQS